MDGHADRPNAMDRLDQLHRERHVYVTSPYGTLPPLSTVVPDGRVRGVGRQAAEDLVADRFSAAVVDLPLLYTEFLSQHQHPADEIMLAQAQLDGNRFQVRVLIHGIPHLPRL